MGRLWKGLAVLATTLAVAMPTAAAPSGPIHRIVAVGDLHGDFIAWRAIAQAAHLVDRQGRWIGGATVLVQTGDVVDRGPDSLKIVQDLMRLQREADRAHGQVIPLVGNHEAMNVTGDFRYVSAGDYAAFATERSPQVREATFQANQAAIEAAYRQRDPTLTPEAIKAAWIAATPLGKLEHQAVWRPNGRIGRWIVDNPAVVVLDGTLFVHGGISPAYVTTPVAEINRKVAAALQAADASSEAIINDPAGPLWYRGLAGQSAEPADAAAAPKGADAPAPPSIEAQLDQIQAAYGVKRVVIGHTPALSEIKLLYGGRLARIDTGISIAYGGKLTWLEILDGALVPHVVDRPAGDTKGGT